MNAYLKNLNRIEILETLACTGRCRHCSEGDHAGYTAHLDGEAAARAVSEIAGAYTIESLMIFGGEPLLYPRDVCRILKAGREAGIAKREIITNGYFSRAGERIRECRVRDARGDPDAAFARVACEGAGRQSLQCPDAGNSCRVYGDRHRYGAGKRHLAGRECEALPCRILRGRKEI